MAEPAAAPAPETPAQPRAGREGRPVFKPGRHKPEFDNTLWKDRSITGEPKDAAKEVGPRVTSVDLQIEANRRAHHTDQYESEGLLVRRGDDFDVIVHLDKPYDTKTDSIKLVFSTGERAQINRGTLVRVGPGEPKNTSRWGWIFQDSTLDGSGNELALHVTPAADAVVGRYTFSVEVTRTDKAGKRHTHRHQVPGHIIVLFNAWCKDDRVYMKYEARRKEHVLNQTGRIYNGTAKKLSYRPWNFGQFDKIVLDAALYLLEMSYLATHAQGDPSLVTRALSAMCNSNNDGGVLTGNWSGEYEGGTAPYIWNGSVAILDEFMKNKSSVCYGQCWVFSGLLTTVCRTLGIPTRSVTNFQSAHDRDYSMTIDNHVTSNGTPMKFLDDSIWNFHVWNEAWFTRPDLPEGNDGWQVIDSTPQESSEGIMQCGPAPVAAIKEGNVYLGYDTKFIFAEVNGDVINWVFNEETGEFDASGVQKHAVGKMIVTKATFSSSCVSITDDYKYKEDTTEERKAVTRASFHSSRKEFLESVYCRDCDDVTFTWTAAMDQSGETTLSLKLVNTSSETRHVDVKVHALATYYTGMIGETLKSFSQDGVTLEGEKGKLAPLPHQPLRDWLMSHGLAGESCQSRPTSQISDQEKSQFSSQDQTLTWSIPAKEVFNTLDEDATLGTYVLAKVKETKQIFSSEETLTIDKPDLELQIPEGAEVKVGQPVELTIKFKNPLAISLTGIELHLEGPGLQKDLKIPVYGAVKTGEDVTKTVTITPQLSGKRELIASLNSRQLIGISGVLPLIVNT